jgi:hypothetical protein
LFDLSFFARLNGLTGRALDFVRFVTAHAARAFPGSGLGLELVHQAEVFLDGLTFRLKTMREQIE